MLQWPERPVIVLGHGVRLAGADITPLLGMNVPILTSWPAADLVDSDHPNYFGRPGVYGQRCANKVLANADLVLAIGCRLSIWTVGYDFPRNGQRVVMVDVDGVEARKFEGSQWINADAKEFIRGLEPFLGTPGWMLACRTWRTLYPWLESPAHDDANGYINPHRFMSRLQAHLKPDAIIAADCATGSLAAHQILRLKPPQRLLTSGGLGEMGCGLPAAIGASFGTGKGPVVCLTSDGGIMLTLQELATVAHHRLPIKIIVFCNQGYGMIKDTQRNLGMEHYGTGSESLKFPDFVVLAHSFGIDAFNASDVPYALDFLFSDPGPTLLRVDIDPEYRWAPKLRPSRNADGTIKNADFAEMEPKL
jgi:acetolactate synthase-1/2/3 large subunit